jgi:hypothetical protein
MVPNLFLNVPLSVKVNIFYIPPDKTTTTYFKLVVIVLPRYNLKAFRVPSGSSAFVPLA